MIRFVSAPCGAGKTHQLIKRASKLAHAGERVLLVQPTRELINKTVTDELLARPRPPRYHVYHGDTAPGAVASAVTKHFNDAEAEGQIVFITHAVMPFVPFWANKRDWHVLVDEEFQVLRHKCHQLPHTHPIITDHIELEPYNSIYGRMVVRDQGELGEKGRNREEDELFGHLAELVKTLTNSHWESFVSAEQYEKLKAGKSGRLSVHSVLKPGVLEGFGSVLMASANFQDTAQYRLWADKGVRFKEDREFAADLRFRSHPNGHLLDIHYALESPWSAKNRDATGQQGDQATNLGHIARAATDLFGQDRFVWQANKSIPDSLFGPKAERLPNKPHGLNSFANVHNIAFLSALNPKTEHFQFLGSLGLAGEDVRTAVYHSTAYQAVMRTSIRVGGNQDRKIIVVPDRGLAEYLQHRFPGSGVHKLETGIIEDTEARKSGRPRRHQSNKARVAEQRAKARAEKLRVLNEQFSLSLAPDNSCPGLRAEKGITLITHFSTQPLPCLGTLYPGKFSPWPSAYVAANDPDCFVEFLKNCHTKRVGNKEDLPLISPSIFDPCRPGAPTKRGLRKYRLRPPPLARFRERRFASGGIGRLVSSYQDHCHELLSPHEGKAPLPWRLSR